MGLILMSCPHGEAGQAPEMQASGMSLGLEVLQTRDSIPALSSSGCVTLGHVPDLSEPHFPQL